MLFPSIELYQLIPVVIGFRSAEKAYEINLIETKLKSAILGQC